MRSSHPRIVNSVFAYVAISSHASSAQKATFSIHLHREHIRGAMFIVQDDATHLLCSGVPGGVHGRHGYGRGLHLCKHTSQAVRL